MDLNQDKSKVKAFAIKYASKYWTVLFALALILTTMAIIVLLWAISPNFEPSEPEKEEARFSLTTKAEYQNRLVQRLTELQKDTKKKPVKDSSVNHDIKKSIHHSNDKITSVASPQVLDTKLKEPVSCIKTELANRWGDFVRTPIHIKLLNFHTESADKLKIYKGYGQNGEKVTTWSGVKSSEHIVVNDTMELTFSFRSDGSVVKDGWKILVYPEGTDTSNPIPIKINEQLRKNNVIVSKPVNGAIYLYDSGGSSYRYNNNERIDLPIAFSAGSNSSYDFVDKYVVGINADEKLKELNALCRFAKNTNTKLPVLTARLIQSLKLTSNPQERSFIFDLFERTAKLTANVEDPESIQFTMSQYLFLTLKRLVDEQKDIKFAEVILKIFSPFDKGIISVWEEFWFSILDRHSEVAYRTISQYLTLFEEIKLPKGINNGTAFLELFQLNLNRYNQAQKRVDNEYQEALSQYRDNTDSFHSTRANKSSLMMSSATSVMAGLIIMGIFALALVLISIERATSKLLLAAQNFPIPPNIDHKKTLESNTLSTELEEPSTSDDSLNYFEVDLVVDEERINQKSLNQSKDENESTLSSEKNESELSRDTSSEPSTNEEKGIQVQTTESLKEINWAELSGKAFIQGKSQISICMLSEQNDTRLTLIKQNVKIDVMIHPDDISEFILLKDLQLLEVKSMPVVLLNPEVKLIAFAYGNHDRSRLQFTKGTPFKRHTSDLIEDSIGWILYRIV